MNSAKLKLEIIKQVEMLEDDVLNEIQAYIQNRLGVQSHNGLEELTDMQIAKLKEAQDSLKLGKGVSHEDIKAKYRSKYGIA
jgi:hypothetical protein